ncbi:group III truncated hemoglobin [Chitinophaga silvatica]|uniref:group III truncated hemoglobin n=1 Tax=Chitinophaga silvatica TaxID=2282649 RepID=UPI0018F1B0E0|nr:group III truncated hemoglobin [Chitinophaga silvatica]
MALKEIENRDDVQKLVDTFYSNVQNDKVLGYIFNDIAKVDWERHLPKMYNFWDSLLLEGTYTGNAMQPHFRVNKLIPLEDAYFNRWLEIWESTVHSLFTGEKAELAIYRAKSIKEVMAFKINRINHPPQHNTDIPIVNPDKH